MPAHQPDTGGAGEPDGPADGTASERSFPRLLLAALLVSSAGDEITQVALVFRVAPGASGMEVSSLLLALLLPGAVVAPYAGKLVDEHDAARVLAVAAALQAMVAAMLAFTTGIAAALLGAAVLSLLFAFSGAATFALLPIVGRAAGLPPARINAAMEVATGGGSVLGPLIGGMLIALGGVKLALLIDAVTFGVLAAVAALAGIARAPEPSHPGGWSPRAVLRSYGPVLRHRRVVLMLLSFWIVVAALAVSDAVYVFLVTQVLGQGPLLYGALMSAWAAAYLLGAWPAGAFVQRRPYASALTGGAAMAACFLAIGLAGYASLMSAAVVGAAFFIGGLGNALYNVSVRTILHTDLPAALHGRGAALYGLGVRGAEATGFVGGGLFGPARVLTAYTVSGIGAFGAALAAMIGQRSRRGGKP